MNERQQSPSWKKTLGLAYGIVVAFSAAYFVGGVLLDKFFHKEKTS